MEFSDEAKTCTECKSQGFTFSNDVIQDAGKFEGETVETFHAYHVMLEGGADDDDENEWRVGNMICAEDSNGFVYGDVLDTEAEAVRQWNDADIRKVNQKVVESA